MLTALVVDVEAAARRQVAGLLELGGWLVHEAADADEARWLNQVYELDLVVTDGVVPGATGPDLLRLFRRAGSTARFLVVAAEPTEALRAEAAAAGALATLAKPVDARLLLDLVTRRSGEPIEADVVQDIVDVEDLHEADLDADLMDRLHVMYDDALPSRFSEIDRSVRESDPGAVAAAAFTLAGASGQLGHPAVADVCQAIAADARRGIMAHSRVSVLAGLAGIDRRIADRRAAVWQGEERRRIGLYLEDRRVAELDRRGQLAYAADALEGRMDPAGLVHAAEAAAGRLATRRGGFAA